MASKFMRRQNWWIKLRHPATGQIIRESLETQDEARAELLREKIDLEAALLEPRFGAVEIPGRLCSALGLSECGAARNAAAPIISLPSAGIPIAREPVRRTPVDEAVANYLRFIESDNAPSHVANKISMLRRFLGWDRLEKICGPDKHRAKNRRGQNRRARAPFFTGRNLDEITPALVQGFIEGLPVGRKTKRHYREFFHHFFEVCLKFDIYRPTNWHRPNPIAALPSYLSRNRRIVFLTEEQVEEQLDALRDEPEMQIAGALMIFAGLRRSEALWLTKNSISKDLTFFSVLNRIDEEDDIEGSLKTGERPVTILPELQKRLREYLPKLRSDWLIPNPSGKRWSADGFSKKLHRLNKAHGLKWSCFHFRHTYATQRAAEGWPLFRIAKEMGNSVQVVEDYYAAYVRPPAVTSPSSNSEVSSVSPPVSQLPSSGIPASRVAS